MKTANIIDFKPKSETLAKVVISHTGDVDRTFLRERISAALDNKAVPVMSSFKQVTPGVSVGFVRANREVRVPTKSEISAKYRVMSTNILMDNTDKSLWEVQEGASGKFLARRGQEDLASLIQASLHRRPDLPQLRHITIAKATASEVVAFVDKDGDVDHGFAIATNDEAVRVLSFARRVPVNVEYDNVVSISPVTIPADLHKMVASSLTPAEKKDEKAYYERLYGFDPAYVRDIAEQIDAGTDL